MRTLELRGGTWFDGHRYRGSGSVVLAGDRVLATGQGAVGRGDRVLDVTGCLVAPGFVDAHVHAVQGGLHRIRCDLSGGATREDYLAAIATYAAEHPELPWILGGGWAMPAFPGGTPTAADLDAVVPDRPVFLTNRDLHGAWVSSRTLELAGIDRFTPDPVDGRIERRADGSPSGTLHEGAMALAARHVPATTHEEYYAGLLAGQAHLLSLGVTGWQDAIVGAYAGMDDAGPTYRLAAERGDLVVDVVGALWWDRERGLDQVRDLLARRADYSRPGFRATSVKIMQDGVPENFTAAMSTPYLDECGHPTSAEGLSFVDPDLLRRALPHLSAEGFQVHVHAIGDRGVREALDALAEVPEALRLELRHHVAHVQVVHPRDLGRFAELGVAANCQALWACLDDQMVDLNLPFLGEERGRWQYPFGDLHRTGARLVMGSDWPVSSPDPVAAIHTAVNRTSFGDLGRAGHEPFLPEQALTLETAWAAYTSGSAWVNHRDDAGVLRPGAAADLVVLDRDPFGEPPEEIGAARVASTWVGGVPVFDATHSTKSGIGADSDLPNS